MCNENLDAEEKPSTVQEKSVPKKKKVKKKKLNTVFIMKDSSSQILSGRDHMGAALASGSYRASESISSIPKPSNLKL